MGIAAINPEAIVIVAFGQWRDARRLKHEWKMHFKDKKFPAKPGPNKASQKSNKKDPEPKPVESDWPELKMETAFFVVMGGFVIDESLNKSDKHSPSRHIEKLEKRPTHDKKPWLENRPFPTTFIATLTPRGFVKCLKEGYFDDMEYPAFNFNTIQDKGNTNRFAKFLSSLQVLWLFIQSLQRYISGLTLTYVLPSDPTVEMR